MLDIFGTFDRAGFGWLLWEAATLLWTQLLSIRGGLASMLFVGFLFHPPTAAKIEAFFKTSRRKAATLALAFWYGLCVVWVATGHIVSGDHMVAAAERNVATANVAISTDQKTIQGLEATLKTANDRNVELAKRPPPPVIQRPSPAPPAQTMTNSAGALQAGRDINIAGQPSAADVAKRAAQRAALAELLTKGQMVRARVVQNRGDEASEKEAGDWYNECANYLLQNLGPDYAAQFRIGRPSANAIAGFPMAKMGLVNGIEARLEHLIDFITRLR